MSFLYEPGVNDFAPSVANLRYDPNLTERREGVVGGYIDDLYWAATLTKIVEAIKLAMV